MEKGRRKKEKSCIPTGQLSGLFNSKAPPTEEAEGPRQECACLSAIFDLWHRKRKTKFFFLYKAVLYKTVFYKAVLYFVFWS